MHGKVALLSSMEVFIVMECAILSQSGRDVKRLIRDGADVNAIYQNMYTPTTLASTLGNVDIVKILLDAGADPCLVAPMGGDCAIHAASRHDHTLIIKELAARGYSLEVCTSDDGLSPLFIAAQNGSTNAVKALLESGAQLEWKHEGAYTALYSACQFGQSDVVAVLLNAGAFTGRQGKHGFTPLMQSSHRGYVKVVKLLLNHGCPLDVKNDQGCTALHLAASANRVKVMAELLDRGADPSILGPQGYTAVDFAKQGGLEAQKLLEQRRRERQKVPPGSTPLHRCVLADDYEGAASLLDDGEPPNEPDGNGLTALHRAVMALEPKCIVALLRGGANEKTIFPPAYGVGLSPIGYTDMAEKMAGGVCAPNGATLGEKGFQHIRGVRDLLLRATALRGKSWKWPVEDGGDTSPYSESEEEGEESSFFEEVDLAGKGGSQLRGVRFQQAGQLPNQGVIVVRAMNRYAQKTL